MILTLNNEYHCERKMLRSMSMCNFVHFEEPQIINFGKPVNFIIGRNSSGKTAIFELIRRCYSYKLSSTKSSIPKDDKLAYVICKFEITKHYPKLHVGKENPYRVFSFVFSNKNGNLNTNVHKRYWFKGVCLNYKTKNCLLTYVSKYEYNFDSTKTAKRQIKFEDLHINDIAKLFYHKHKRFAQKFAQTLFNEISNFQKPSSDRKIFYQVFMNG